MPIRSRLFDERFKLLELDSDLEGHCTWDKYQEYNCWIGEIQSYLSDRINKDFTMIDAHSFVWVLPGIEEYLDSSMQVVEHKKFGKGIVTNIREDGTIIVHFGKEERIFMSDVFDNGILTIVPNDFNIYGDDEIEELYTNDNRDNSGIRRDAKDEQALRDEEYPKEYVSNIKINQSDWVELLKNNDVFYESNIELLKKIFLGIMITLEDLLGMYGIK